MGGRQPRPDVCQLAAQLFDGRLRRARSVHQSLADPADPDGADQARAPLEAMRDGFNRATVVTRGRRAQAAE
jgi:hypothetical protein